MSEYLFLYRSSSSNARSGSPEEIQARMQKWRAWFQSLEASGHLKNMGQPLEEQGAVVKGAKAVTDGPYAEKDLVGGFSVVEARDLAHASELAKGCPILAAGGVVEVRPVMKM